MLHFVLQHEEDDFWQFAMKSVSTVDLRWSFSYVGLPPVLFVQARSYWTSEGDCGLVSSSGCRRIGSDRQQEWTSSQD